MPFIDLSQVDSGWPLNSSRETILKYFFAWLCMISACLAQDRNLESFDRVWSIIEEKHWDLEGTGVDWQAIRTRYRPKAEKAANRAEWRRVIRDMIGELDQTHFGLLSSEPFQSLRDLESKLVRGPGITGFEVQIVDQKIMVVRSIDFSVPLALPIGTEIVSIRDVKAESIVASLQQAYGQAKQGSLYISRVLQSFLSGFPGDNLPLEIKVPTNTVAEPREIKLHRTSGITQQMGDLPPMHFKYNETVLDNSYGLVSFNMFLFPLTKLFPKSLESFENCKGLIIDLRGNGGGIGFLASNLAGYLFQTKGKLGTMTSKDSQINFPILPRPKTWEKPVAVIVDGGSASTSEIFAAGIQDLKRGAIFGTRSAGAALPSFIETLPNGDLFQYAFASYRSVNGRYLEGNGVTPNKETPHNPDHLARGEDAAIEAAKQWIEQTLREQKK